MNLFRLPCGIPWGGARRLVLTLACLFALSGLSAQNVTLRFERAKLKTVMDEITRQCDLSFAYSREVVDADRIVSIDLKDAPISTARRCPVTRRSMRRCRAFSRRGTGSTMRSRTAKSCFRPVNRPCMSTPLSRDGWPTTRTARSWGRPWSWRALRRVRRPISTGISRCA